MKQHWGTVLGLVHEKHCFSQFEIGIVYHIVTHQKSKREGRDNC